MPYKWNNPAEWLALALAGQLDSDEIQDLYQSEMDADGYFEEEATA